MAQLERCCCGCSLRAASIMIAALYVVASLGQVPITLEDMNSKEITETSSSDNGRNDSQSSLSNTNNIQTENPVSKAQLIFDLVLLVIQAIGGIILFIGALKEAAGILHRWVVVQMLVVAVSTVARLIECLQLMEYEGGAFMSKVRILALFTGLALHLYFILVVCSYFLTLTDASRPSASNLTVPASGEVYRECTVAKRGSFTHRYCSETCRC